MFLKKKVKKTEAPEGMKLLITTSDNFEADIIESYLKPSGIPVIRRYRESGAYLTLLFGNSAFGVDLFVPEDRAEEARELLETANSVRDEEILSDPSFNDESLICESQDFLKKLEKRTKWMAVIFIAIVLILICLIISEL